MKIALSLAPAFLLLLATLANLGCATSFQGRAQFRNGPRGCASHCARQSLRMAQFVYVGEHSSACVCEPPTRAGAMQAAEPQGASSGAAVAAAAGVMTQMREQQRPR